MSQKRKQAKKNKVQNLPVLEGRDHVKEKSDLSTSNTVQETTKIYRDNIKFNGQQGHGFAAEEANHIADKMSGKDAQIVGRDNAKNGADRLVNGKNIQTKYCATPAKCIDACFDKGNFRYFNEDRSLMKLEVPKGMGDEAKQAFIRKMRNGQVKGVDPNASDKVLKKIADKTIIEGSITYKQAQNIAKFGNIDSIKFDAQNGAYVAAGAFALSTFVECGRALQEGKSIDIAIKQSLYVGMNSGSQALLIAVTAAQLGKTQLVNKGSEYLIATYRSYFGKISQTATKELGKKLSSNAATAIVTVTVLSAMDFKRLIDGRISIAQLAKNVTKTTANVVAGIAGYAATGAAVGSVLPGFGNLLGGAVGIAVGLAGGVASSMLADKVTGDVLDAFIKDDAVEMQEILNLVFSELAEDFLLSEKEANAVIEQLKEKLSINFLQEMFRADNRAEFAHNFLHPLIVREVQKRKRITDKDLPSLFRFKWVYFKIRLQVFWWRVTGQLPKDSSFDI